MLRVCVINTADVNIDLSPPQASDRAFLEELLVYLRQQRRQLDESRRLLEKLERQQQQQQAGVPHTSHIRVETAESGTIPVVTTTTYSTRSSPARSSSGTATGQVGIVSAIRMTALQYVCNWLKK